MEVVWIEVDPAGEPVVHEGSAELRDQKYGFLRLFKRPAIAAAEGERTLWFHPTDFWTWNRLFVKSATPELRQQLRFLGLLPFDYDPRRVEVVMESVRNERRVADEFRE
ncbi:MAG: hypothetical protein WBX15_13415 [Thermoanaerobaculia bacterium]